MTETVVIRSRDNPLVKELRKLSSDNLAYRKSGRIWVEGDHLCDAALRRDYRPDLAVFAESYWPGERPDLAHAASKTILLADAVFASISALESPAKLGFVFKLPEGQPIQPSLPTVILDRVQDAGNVGSILRSASAFGFHQVLTMQGSAALWSSKVLRAGMGAHFSLSLKENLSFSELDGLKVPLIVTSSHSGVFIHERHIPRPCAWVFGHEGQGVAQHFWDKAEFKVRISQPGGEESLNVAAAAAICLHSCSF